MLFEDFIVGTRSDVDSLLHAMGDDPYDFEIAIPSGGGAREGGGGGNAKNYGSRRYGSDSSDVSVSNSDDQGGDDSDEDEEEDSPVKVVAKQHKHNAQSAASVRPTASAGASGVGSSALDKAKSFLSKYSTKSVDTKQSKPQASSRSSRRVELNLDDSMDFSSDEDEEESDRSSRKLKNTSAKAKAPSSTPRHSQSTPVPTRRVQLSDSEDYGVDSDDDRSHKLELEGARGATKQGSESDNGDNTRRTRDVDLQQQQKATVPPTSTTSRPMTAATAVSRAVESSVEEYADDAEEEEEEVASFMNESDEGDPPPFSTAVAPKVTVSDAAKLMSVSQPTNTNFAAKNLDKSEEHDESVASRSDYVESFDDEGDEPSSTKPGVGVSAKRAVNAFESGAYEDEGFDEESAAAPTQTVNQPPISRFDDSTKIVEPAYDYSMDFSDDNAVAEGKLETLLPPTPSAGPIQVTRTESAREQVCAPPSPASSHSNDGHSQSDYLESDDDRSAADTSQVTTSDDKKIALSLPHPSELTVVGVYNSPAPGVTIHNEPKRSDIDGRDACEADKVQDQSPRGSLAPSVVLQVSSSPEVAIWTMPSNQKPKSPVVNHTSDPPCATATPSVTTRGRVLIVREYELPRQVNVETKDASTQFTGNHAAIQADLTPDGMHSLQSPSLASVPEAPVPPSSSHHPTPIDPCRSKSAGESCDPHLAPGVSSSPPPAPILGSTGYTMDLLRMPTATTTSIYKQQLLELQEQILMKKRETERFVHERMAFQYSSLRGTERFLATNRPGKLELWQALMRVDPTLTERKAREIARLTGENAAA